MDVGASGGASAGGIAAVPSQAPALVWVVLLGAVALWWLWPWLALLRGDHPRQDAIFGAPPREAGGLRLPHVPLVAAAAASPTAPFEEAAGRLDCDLSFDLATEFSEAFCSAAKGISLALQGPPSGQAYTAALTALKKLAEILDRAFLAFASTEELAKVTCLREASEAFRRDFGEHRLGEAMRGLLQAAGFERRGAAAGPEAAEVGGADGDGVWVFPHEDALARLRGLTVRLCLQKSADLQKARGPGRFLHTNNDAVVPKLEDAAFVELVDLYRGRAASSGAAPAERPSLRERAMEADVRIKLNQRRAERGFDAVGLHEGLAAIARTLAEAQRTRARKDADDLYPTRQVAAEVRALVSRLPLPPGFSVAHLHWSSTELPRLFGLTSTRGGARGSKDEAEGDSAAEILANEAVGFWAVRQQRDVMWPAATICGVGAALDYTVNKGFAVALLVGFEEPGEGGPGAASCPSELRRRPSAAAAAAAAARPRVTEPVKFSPAASARPRITGFKDLYNPKPAGGG